jgi:hypothetical protein
VEAAEAFMKI